jgi:uncharacterized protein (TIGR02453 family)
MVLENLDIGLVSNWDGVMANHFTAKTYKYFDQAHENRFNKKWFEDNQGLYEEHVKMPFSHLLGKIYTQLPLADLTTMPKKVSRPLRPSHKADCGLVKDFASINISEKKVSRFEWNPAVKFQVGGHGHENFVGVGLYMISSRQMKELRKNLVYRFDEIDKLLKKKNLTKSWQGLEGEIYKRFPHGYDQDDRRHKYLWHKQFYLQQSFTRTEVKQKDFADTLVKDLKAAMPFYQWVRESVGKAPERTKL